MVTVRGALIGTPAGTTTGAVMGTLRAVSGAKWLRQPPGQARWGDRGLPLSTTGVLQWMVLAKHLLYPLSYAGATLALAYG
jgi:hypothetical protein